MLPISALTRAIFEQIRESLVAKRTFWKGSLAKIGLLIRKQSKGTKISGLLCRVRKITHFLFILGSHLQGFPWEAGRWNRQIWVGKCSGQQAWPWLGDVSSNLQPAMSFIEKRLWQDCRGLWHGEHQFQLLQQQIWHPAWQQWVQDWLRTLRCYWKSPFTCYVEKATSYLQDKYLCSYDLFSSSAHFLHPLPVPHTLDERLTKIMAGTET